MHHLANKELATMREITGGTPGAQVALPESSELRMPTAA